jgi:hypothetical protein
VLQYTLCDVILLFQIYYYRWQNPEVRNQLGTSYAGAGSSDENAPLLDHGPPVAFVQRPPSAVRQILKLISLLVLVLFLGAFAWFVDDRFINGGSHHEERPEVIELKSQIVGWISATLYRKLGCVGEPSCPADHGCIVGSRIPQIREQNSDLVQHCIWADCDVAGKNVETKCEGML